MIIKRLRLTKAIGLTIGAGVESVDLDLSTSAGLIAIVGPNGAGKTTLLKNLQPYIIPGEKFADGFYQDGARELWFEHGGHAYESVLKNTRGKVVASLKKDGTELNPSNNQTSYMKLLEENLGPVDVFFQTVFCSQRAYRLVGLRRALRQELFYRLNHLDHYQAKAEKIDEMVKEIRTKLSSVDIAASAVMLASTDLLGVDISAELVSLAPEDLQAWLAANTSQLVAGYEEDISRGIRAIEEAQHNVDTTLKCFDIAKAQLAKLEDQDKQFKLWQQRMETWPAEDPDKLYATVAKLEADKDALSNKLASIRDNAAEASRLAGKVELLRALKAQLPSLEATPRECADYERALANSQALQSELPCTFLSEYVGEAPYKACPAYKKVASSLDELRRLKGAAEAAEAASTAKRNNLLSQIDSINAELGDTDWVQEAREANKDLAETSTKLTAVSNELAAVSAKLSAGKPTVAISKPAQVPEEELAGVRNQVSSLHSQLVSQTTALDQRKEAQWKLTSALDQARAKVTGLINIATKFHPQLRERAQLERDLVEWNIIASACSYSQMPSAELELVSADIERWANVLLAGLNPDGITVRLETRKESDKGKELDTLDFRIYRPGLPSCLIEDLSDSQKAWVEEAIIEAALVRQTEGTNQGFMTSFTDETGATMTPDNAQAFLEFKRRAMELTNRSHRFAIIQNPALYSQLATRIVVDPQSKSVALEA